MHCTPLMLNMGLEQIVAKRKRSSGAQGFLMFLLGAKTPIVLGRYTEPELFHATWTFGKVHHISSRHQFSVHFQLVRCMVGVLGRPWYLVIKVLYLQKNPRKKTKKRKKPLRKLRDLRTFRSPVVISYHHLPTIYLASRQFC